MTTFITCLGILFYLPTGDCDCNQFQEASTYAFYGQTQGLKMLDTEYKPITFASLHLNEGKAFNPSSAKFTAVESGIYQFTVTVTAQGSGALPVVLFHNDLVIATTARGGSTTIGKFTHSTNLVLLTLDVGDTVSLKTRPKHSGLWGSITEEFVSPSDVMFAGQAVAIM